jgi:hypothetical protein
LKLIAESKHVFEEYYDNDDLLREKLGIVKDFRHVSTLHDRIISDESNNNKDAKSFIKRIA